MIDYRNAVNTDGEALDAMARRVWLATFGHSAPPGDIDAYVAHAYGADGLLRRHLADPAYDFQLALERGVVVGYCKVGPTFFNGEVPTEGTLHLHQLYVDPAAHGSGVAAHLLDWACGLARRRNRQAILLTVWEENHRARAFYAKHGFVHIGDYAFKTGDQIDRDLIMRLDL
ncbi:Acetyltransferase (GNAT) family protein [Sphingomonas sp. OV641]|uniref:GNAT family N-acetyltransferase n=1 Tax=unclassified Sphingomonas TaxID=196159 RepID=UPI00082EF528|nr:MULTISPECIES: GNAT family N-acetyltransferase [unclassified Sphingomonas]SEJ61713.1 Acetyltransferase (GNAT) family protein [Sphingomonas sp. OV641]